MKCFVLQIAASLGKGKRVRRQVNYAEAEKGQMALVKGPYREEVTTDRDNYSDYAPSSSGASRGVLCCACDSLNPPPPIGWVQ